MDALSSGLLEPADNTCFVQLLQEAAALVCQQVRQVVLGNLLHHFLGKGLYEIGKWAAFLKLEPLP